MDWTFGKDYETGVEGVVDLNPDDNPLTDQTDSTFGYTFIQGTWSYDPEDPDDRVNKDVPPTLTVDPNPPSADQDPWIVYKDKIYDEMLDLAFENAEKNNPSLVVTREMLIFTEEEKAGNGITGRANCFNHVRGSMGQWMSGQLDVYDDKVWADWCDLILNELGGKDYLDICQAAYDRYLANVG